MFENPRRGRKAKNFTTNVPKILDLKSSSEQIFSENCRWVPQVRDNACQKTLLIDSEREEKLWKKLGLSLPVHILL